MLRTPGLLLLAMGLLMGCRGVSPFATLPGRAGNGDETQPSLTKADLQRIENELRLEVENLDDLLLPDQQYLREQVANVPRGSQVGINDGRGRRFSGTVLRSGSDELTLMNCISQEAVAGPAGMQQCKTSHVPFQSFQTATLTHFVVIAPPPPGFPAEDDAIDGTDYSVGEIVNRSGQRQRWGQPPVRGETSATAPVDLVDLEQGP